MRRDRRRVRTAPSAPPADAKGGRWLALVPVGVALFLAALMLPRAVVPELLPLPEIDDRVIRREVGADTERAQRAREVPLPAEVRELGSAIREFNSLEAQDAADLDLVNARTDLDRARLRVFGRDKDEDLRELRAVQMEGFLAEVRRFERTGEPSAELDALGGTFIRRMRKVGWCQGHDLVLTDLERRVAFKATWNTLLDADKKEAFKLSAMETRALYTLYFQHPHAAEAQRDALALARMGATDKAACDRINDTERIGTEAWLLTKLGEYAAIDPSYPLLIARGIALYRRHQYEEAARSFTAWLDVHPDGPWTLRARNYLRASHLAEQSSF